MRPSLVKNKNYVSQVPIAKFSDSSAIRDIFALETKLKSIGSIDANLILKRDQAAGQASRQSPSALPSKTTKASPSSQNWSTTFVEPSDQSYFFLSPHASYLGAEVPSSSVQQNGRGQPLTGKSPYLAYSNAVSGAENSAHRSLHAPKAPREEHKTEALEEALARCVKENGTLRSQVRELTLREQELRSQCQRFDSLRSQLLPKFASLRRALESLSKQNPSALATDAGTADDGKKREKELQTTLMASVAKLAKVSMLGERFSGDRVA